MTRILGVDPGETTGVATYLDGKFYSLQLPSTDAGPFLMGFIDAAARRPGILHVACERYVIGTNTAKKSRQPAAAALIGVLKEHSRPLNNIIFEQQNASEAKKLGNNVFLKRIEWFNPGKGHANDAARHILLFLLRHFPEEFMIVRAGGTIEINRAEVVTPDDGGAQLWLERI